MELLTSDATVANLLMNCTNNPGFSRDYDASPTLAEKGLGSDKRNTHANPYLSKQPFRVRD